MATTKKAKTSTKSAALPSVAWRVTLAIKDGDAVKAWSVDVDAPTIRRAAKAARKVAAEQKRSVAFIAAVARVDALKLAVLS